MASCVGGAVAMLEEASESVEVDVSKVSSGSSFTQPFADTQEGRDAH